MRLRALALIVLCAGLHPYGVLAQSDASPPLPDRNPARAGAPAAAAKPLPGEMPTVTWTETEITAAKDKCNELLGSMTVVYQVLDPIKEGLCGAPAPILVRSIGSDPKVEIDPPATISCPLAKELGDWLADTVQPKAKALLGSAVVKLRNATSYACRNRYGGADTLLSEHALANALDVSEFDLASGVHITVLESWPKVVTTPPVPLPNPAREPTATSAISASTAKGGRALDDHHAIEVTKAKAVVAAAPSPPPVDSAPDPDPKAEFVKQVHDDACHDFGTVLGPEANAAHKNHFHLDMKARRGSSFCQ